AYNRTDNQENITHQGERQCRDDATHQYQQLQRGGFGFLCSQRKPDLEKFYNRAEQSQRVIEQTGMSRRIARWRALAAHFRSVFELSAGKSAPARSQSRAP